MNVSKVIVALTMSAILAVAAIPATAAQNLVDKRVDSLFAIAASGSVKFKDMVQPAIDSTAAMGVNAVPRLLEKLATKSPRERVTLVAILKKIGSPAVPGLLTSLKLGEGLAVERAAYSLGDTGDSSAVDGLLAAAGHERWQVREQVIGALGKLHSHRADNAVMNAFNDSIPLVRKSAAVSSGQLKIAGSIPLLVHLLGDPFYGARMPASLALFALDTTTVIKALADSIKSDNLMIGNLACWVLGRMHKPEATALLVEQANSTIAERRSHAACALVEADAKQNAAFIETYRKSEADSLALLRFESAIEAASHVQPVAKP
jgi:HEAT repeat protein